MERQRHLETMNLLLLVRDMIRDLHDAEPDRFKPGLSLAVDRIDQLARSMVEGETRLAQYLQHLAGVRPSV